MQQSRTTSFLNYVGLPHDVKRFHLHHCLLILLCQQYIYLLVIIEDNFNFSNLIKSKFQDLTQLKS